MSSETEGREEELARIRERAASDKRSAAEVQARALAKARNEVYNPAIHGPFDPKMPPRQQKKQAPKPTAIDAELEKIMQRFSEKAPYRYQPRTVK